MADLLSMDFGIVSDGAEEFKGLHRVTSTIASSLVDLMDGSFDKGLINYTAVPAVFYCEWAGLEHGEELDADAKALIKRFHPACCFSHFFGLPTIKTTHEDGRITESEPTPYNGYQKPWISDVVKYKFLSNLKCRGAGWSELITVRWKLYRAIINHIKNRKFIIVAGTRQELAVEFLARMKVLCDRRPFVYKVVPRSEEPRDLYIGCSHIMALPADPEVVRGQENVEDVDLEEPSAWDRVNDQPVLDAAEPLVAKGARLRVTGTPKLRRGFFWHKIWNPEVVSKYHKAETFIDDVLNAEHPLISRAEVEKIKTTDPRAWRQEFNREFLLPEDSLFGQLTDANISDSFGAIQL